MSNTVSCSFVFESITAMIEEELERAAAESKKDETTQVATVETTQTAAEKPKPPPKLTPSYAGILLAAETRKRVNGVRGEGQAMISAAEFVARIMWRDCARDPELPKLEKIVREHAYRGFCLRPDTTKEEARELADGWMANGRHQCMPLKSKGEILGYLKFRFGLSDDKRPSEPPATKRPPKKSKAARAARLAAALKARPMESMVVPAEPPRELTEEEQLELEIAEEEARRAAEEREIEALIAEEEAAKAKAEQAAEAVKAAAKAARGKAKAEARAAAKAQKRAA